MSAKAIASAVENALDASQLPAPTLGNLKAQYENATQLLGAAGWHGPDDIETLVGLGGLFLWPEDPFAFRTINFTFDSDKVGFQGGYKIANGVFTVEEGIFHSVPNNPASGFAAVVLVPQGGSAPRPFVVAGMFTDNNWKIIIALLNKIGPSGLIQPPFSAVRVS